MQGVADAAGYLDAVKPELTCFVKYLREYIFDFVKAKRKRELAAAAKRKAALAKAALALENGGDIGDIVSSQEEEEAQADGDFEAEEVAWLFACKQVPAKHLFTMKIFSSITGGAFYWLSRLLIDALYLLRIILERFFIIYVVFSFLMSVYW